MMYKFGIFEKQKISFKTETLPFDIKTKMTNGIYVLVFRESRKQKIDLQFLKNFGNFQKIDAPIQGGLDYSQVLHALLCKYQSSSGKKSWVFECIGWCSIAAKKSKRKVLIETGISFSSSHFLQQDLQKDSRSWIRISYERLEKYQVYPHSMQKNYLLSCTYVATFIDHCFSNCGELM